jgi:hypothetical protein
LKKQKEFSLNPSRGGEVKRTAASPAKIKGSPKGWLFQKNELLPDYLVKTCIFIKDKR